MMDWSTIIMTLITALVPSGGILAIATIAEKKSGMMLDNANKLAEGYKALANEYQERESKTQEMLEKKEEELLSQIKMNSSLRHQLDDAHTESAVAKLVYCRKFATCVEKDPPFAKEAEEILNRMEHPGMIKGVNIEQQEDGIE